MNILGRYLNKADPSTSSYKELKELSKSDSKRNGYLVVKDDGTLKRYGFIRFHLQGGKEKLQGDKLDRAIYSYVAKKISEKTPLTATEYQLIDKLAQRVLSKGTQSDLQRDIQSLLNALKPSTSLSSQSPSTGESSSLTSTLMPRETLNELFMHLEYKNVSEQEISSVVTKNFLKSLSHPDDISRMQVVIQNNPKIWEAVALCCSHDVSHTMASLNSGKNSLVAEYSKQGFVPDLKPTMQKALNIMVKDSPNGIDFHIYKNLSPDLLLLTVERQMTSRKEPETKENLGFLYNALCKDCLSSGFLEKASQQQASTIVTKQFIQSLSDPDDITSMQKLIQINPAVKDAVAACCAKDIMDSSNPVKKLAQGNFAAITPTSIAKDLEIYTKLSHELVIGQFEQQIARESVPGTRKQLEQIHEVLCKNFFLSSSSNEISNYVHQMSVEAAPEKMITKNVMESLLKQAQKFEDMNDVLSGAIAVLPLVIDANAPLDTLLKQEQQVKQLGDTLTKHAEEHDEFYGNRLPQLEKIITDLNDLTTNVLIPAVSQRAAEIHTSIANLSDRVGEYENLIGDARSPEELSIIKAEMPQLAQEIAKHSDEFRMVERDHIENHPNEINEADRLQNRFEFLNVLQEAAEKKLRLIDYKNKVQNQLSQFSPTELGHVHSAIRKLQHANEELDKINKQYEGNKANPDKFSGFTQKEKDNQEKDYHERLITIKNNEQQISEILNKKTLTFGSQKISLADYKKLQRRLNIVLNGLVNSEMSPLNQFIQSNHQELDSLFSQKAIDSKEPLILQLNQKIDSLKKNMDKEEGAEFRRQALFNIPNENIKLYALKALYPNTDTKDLMAAKTKEALAENIVQSAKKQVLASNFDEMHSKINARQKPISPLKVPNTITAESLQQFEIQLDAYSAQNRAQSLKNEKFHELFNQLLPKISENSDVISTLSKIIGFMPKPANPDEPLSAELKLMYRNTGELVVALSEQQASSLVDKAIQNEDSKAFIINAVLTQKKNKQFQDTYEIMADQLGLTERVEPAKVESNIASMDVKANESKLAELDQIVGTLQNMASRPGWLNSTAVALMENRLLAGIKLISSEPSKVDAHDVEAFNRLIDFNFKNQNQFHTTLITAMKETMGANIAQALLSASENHHAPLNPNFRTILEKFIK